MSDPRNVEWIFVYSRYAAEVESLGYKVVHSVRGRQEKKLLFMLAKNINLPATAAPVETPSTQDTP